MLTEIFRMRWSKDRAYALGDRGVDLSLDLGDGLVLGPEEVLEGHFSRLTAARPNADPGAAATNSLQSAISALVPDLVPLTGLATDLADAVQTVAPEARFRQDLHRALEMSHRQRAVRKQLGAYGPDAANERDTITQLWMVVGLSAIIAALFYACYSKLRTKRSR